LPECGVLINPFPLMPDSFLSPLAFTSHLVFLPRFPSHLPPVGTSPSAQPTSRNRTLRPSWPCPWRWAPRTTCASCRQQPIPSPWTCWDTSHVLSPGDSPVLFSSDPHVRLIFHLFSCAAKLRTRCCGQHSREPRPEGWWEAAGGVRAGRASLRRWPPWGAGGFSGVSLYLTQFSISVLGAW